MKYIKHICLLGVICLFYACSNSYRQNPNVRKPYTPPTQKNTPATLPDAPDPTPSKPTQTTPNYFIHIVKKGETLTAIAKRYQTSVNSIAKTNRLKTSAIKVGQKLYINGSHNPNKTSRRKHSLPNQVRIVPRTSWCKMQMKSNVNPMGHIAKITVHHTTAPKNLAKMSDIQYLNIIEKSHQERGYASIGYHYVIGRDGTIYQGRPVKYQGAHVSGANSNNIGVSLIGDFNKKLPNSSQLKALETMLGYLRKKYQLPATKVYGHKHLGKSQCPGIQLEKWLIKYRKK
ncbi:prophage LambdaCh01, N-acetylmuramoyl-L-alanine amidase [Lentisphaera araneosa HTCC2155]|uniref:Prophage LambdaCh01, N-acetylmuramoyl-L-alanine amidase n=1 Tax=Lentisphaera araneosa HTCC2155 TaxID=313628 RepID=A6DQ08_9BACT|nr:N-acetylmuramoyl-L-alanine amidase [Lentisphaera araneosa]EDM26249.1 prophage LambdaCh01, N-acetylmuramoyl-L-alanine amidase [Lentisphaera araneosa HTCC2155]